MVMKLIAVFKIFVFLFILFVFWVSLFEKDHQLENERSSHDGDGIPEDKNSNGIHEVNESKKEEKEGENDRGRGRKSEEGAFNPLLLHHLQRYRSFIHPHLLDGGTHPCSSPENFGAMPLPENVVKKGEGREGEVEDESIFESMHQIQEAMEFCSSSPGILVIPQGKVSDLFFFFFFFLFLFLFLFFFLLLFSLLFFSFC
jgi:hypothetical protein